MIPNINVDQAGLKRLKAQKALLIKTTTKVLKDEFDFAPEDLQRFITTLEREIQNEIPKKAD